MSVGKIREFDMNSGKWSSYCERLEMYFAANSIKEEVRLATLISVVGDACYELMVNLASPKKPSQLTYAQLVKLVGDHLDPKPSIMAERFKLRQRRQNAGETILQYVAELKMLARTCDFENSLEDNLRDQFVCGVNTDIIRQRLFAEEKLTFQSAVRLACNLEAAERNAAIMHGGCNNDTSVAAGDGSAGARGGVHRVATLAPGGRAAGKQGSYHSQLHASCNGCGASNHERNQCPYRKYICSFCKQEGHLRRVCQKMANSRPSGGRLANKKNTRANAYFVTDGNSDGENTNDGEEEAIYRMSLSQYEAVSLPINVNGKQIWMEIDCGSPASFISMKTYERPVAYVSRRLNVAEQNYSQIHREALAIVYCTQKFHQYLYGRRFVLKTDHKPLVSIFGPQMGVPSMTSSRMQRWALILTGYDFDIRHIKTNENIADALSRLPMGSPKEFEPPEQSYLHFASNALLIDSNEIRLATARDPILGRVLNFLKSGWPEAVDIRELQPYFNRQKELYLELGCIMWGHRVVIPSACRERILQELHEPHMGIVKTKAMARSYVWWPGIDETIEQCCKACSTCAAVAPAPPASAPVPWHWPQRAYERIHIDFLGPLDGRTYLVTIDARTKWIEVFSMKRTTAQCVAHKLLESWSRWGIPKQIVSDNGPPFSSIEFNTFLRTNGVQHVFSAPYHPSSNGAAEGAVKLIKNVIKKARVEGVDSELAILKFLLHYHNTPHSTTGESPARMMQGRDLRIRLDAIKPDRNARVLSQTSKSLAGCTQACREIPVGEHVTYRDYGAKQKWSSGTVVDRLGKSDYTIVGDNGSAHHRHIDQLRRQTRNSLVCPTSADKIAITPTSVMEPMASTSSSSSLPNTLPSSSRESGEQEGDNEEAKGAVEKELIGKEIDNSIEVSVPREEKLNVAVSPRPKRTIKPIQRYGFEFD